MLVFALSFKINPPLLKLNSILILLVVLLLIRFLLVQLNYILDDHIFFLLLILINFLFMYVCVFFFFFKKKRQNDFPLRPVGPESCKKNPPRLFGGMTVMENALVPPRSQVGERLAAAPFPRRWSDQEGRLAMKALQTLAAQQLSGVPLNWATEISGGQMKLLEVSRALMGEPKVLLLDEPTAGVAPKLAREIFDGIRGLRRDLGLTFIVIEHRLDVLFEYVDRVLVMHQGRVIFDGSPADAANDPAVVDSYLGG